MVAKFDSSSLITREGIEKLDASGGNLLRPGGALFFRRQLEHIYPELYKKKLPVLNGLRLFNIDTSPPEGFETHTFRIYEGSGQAEFISDYGTDGPAVDVSGKEQTFPIRDVADSYSFSFREIAAAQMADGRLSMLKPEQARRSIEEKHNRICWYGDAARGLQGILTYRYAPRMQFANPIDPTRTGQQIVDALNDLIYSPRRRTNGVEGQNRSVVLCLPITEATFIESTRMADGTDTTIAQFLMKNNSSLKRIEAVHELAGENQDALTQALLAGKRYAFCYVEEPRVVSYVMPTPFTQLPSEPRAYTMRTNCYSSSGGIKMVYPLATVRAELPTPANV